jgi:3-dehydroquinate synthetase
MKSDKKNNSKNINIILIHDFGRIKRNYQINQTLLKKFLISELNK